MNIKTVGEADFQSHLARVSEWSRESGSLNVEVRRAEIVGYPKYNLLNLINSL